MPRLEQQALELHQATLFLQGIVEHGPLECLPHDPPDVRVPRPGRADLFLELVEYHPTEERVAFEKCWRSDLLPKIDDHRRQRPALAPAWGMVTFKDEKIPPKRRHDALAAELVRAAELLVTRPDFHGWIDAPPIRWIKVSFIDRERFEKRPVIQPGWEWLPSEDWPILAEYVSALRLDLFEGSNWWPWGCPLADTAFTNVSAAEFRRVLVPKHAKLQKAIDTGSFNPDWGPLWLVIVCEVADDVTSHIFPREPEDLKRIRSALAESGFDFARSPFEEVWLFSHFANAKQSLYPEVEGD